MMDWKLHALLTSIIYIHMLLFMRFSILYGAAAMLLLLVASLLPDIDHPKSKVRSLTFSLVFFSLAWFVFLYPAMDMASKAVVILIILIANFYTYKRLPLKHRGKKSLHLWRYALLSLPFSLFLLFLGGMDVTLSVFVFLGYSAHLAIDRIKAF